MPHLTYNPYQDYDIVQDYKERRAHLCEYILGLKRELRKADIPLQKRNELLKDALFGYGVPIKPTKDNLNKAARNIWENSVAREAEILKDTPVNLQDEVKAGISEKFFFCIRIWATIGRYF